MRNIFVLSSLILFGSGLMAFQMAADVQAPPFAGVWQGISQEESAIFIEFSPDGYYRLRVGDNKLTENVESWGTVKYDWGKEKDHYLITIFGEHEPELNTQLEAIFTKKGLLELRVLADSGKLASSILLKKV